MRFLTADCSLICPQCNDEDDVSDFVKDYKKEHNISNETYLTIKDSKKMGYLCGNCTELLFNKKEKQPCSTKRK